MGSAGRGKDSGSRSRGNKVSVVIPAYNAEAFIEDAIKSVFDQTYRPLELVIVNDGSTDSTVARVEGLRSAKPGGVELKIIEIGSNQGSAHALQVGCAAATGDCLCWVSADDMFVDQQKIEKQKRLLDQTRAAWCYFRDFFTGANPSETTRIRPSWLPRLRVLDPLFVRSAPLRLMTLLFRNPINGSSVMIRKDCLEKYGNFDPAMLNADADGDLWMRYSALGLKVAAGKGSPVFYRQHPAQLSLDKLNMIYGSDLTRMRILLALEESGKLLKLVKRYSHLFLLLFQAQAHRDRPLVSEFLCKYILTHEKDFNWIKRRYIEKILKEVEAEIKNYGLDRRKFQARLEESQQSPTLRNFRELMRGRGGEL